MILTGFVLLAVGVGDLVRQFLPFRHRWIGFLVAAVIAIALAAGFDAAVWAFIAIAAAAVWMLLVPSDGSGRAGFWPVGGLAVLCAAGVAAIPARAATGPLGEVWTIAGPGGPVHPDAALLLVGAAAFLLESGNVIVRTALRSEEVAPSAGEPPADASAEPAPEAAAPVLSAAPDATAESAEPAASAPPDLVAGLKGGRLIGPLERVLVFALTLAGAYTLIAAVLAAKGIVRFPEISRDTTTGNRAEYFLVGSLVSWVTALVCALLTWWAGVPA